MSKLGIDINTELVSYTDAGSQREKSYRRWVEGWRARIAPYFGAGICCDLPNDCALVGRQGDTVFANYFFRDGRHAAS